MGAVVVDARHEAAQVVDLAGAEHQLAAGAHHPAQHVVGDRRLGDDALAARAQHVDLRALLVGGEGPLEEVVLDARVVVLDPPAGRLSGLAGHVLARRVARRVVEARVEHPRGRVRLDLLELAGHHRFKYIQ